MFIGTEQLTGYSTEMQYIYFVKLERKKNQIDGHTCLLFTVYHNIIIPFTVYSIQITSVVDYILYWDSLKIRPVH